MGVAKSFTLFLGRGHDNYNVKNDRGSDESIILVDCNSLMYASFLYTDLECVHGEELFKLTKNAIDQIISVEFCGVESKGYEVHLFVDNAEKRPNNKVKRQTQDETVPKKFKGLIEYLTKNHEPSRNYYFNYDNHSEYGEADLQMFHTIDKMKEDGELNFIIFTNDSDMMVFDYNHDNVSVYFKTKNRFLDLNQFNRETRLGFLSSPFLMACVTGCDYGGVVKGCKNPVHSNGLMKQYKYCLNQRARGGKPPKQTFDEVHEIMYRKFATFHTKDLVWCNRDTKSLLLYLKYVGDLYLYYFCGRPFPSYTQHFRASICCEEALNVILLFNTFLPKNRTFTETKVYIETLAGRVGDLPPPKTLGGEGDRMVKNVKDEVERMAKNVKEREQRKKEKKEKRKKEKREKREMEKREKRKEREQRKKEKKEKRKEKNSNEQCRKYTTPSTKDNQRWKVELIGGGRVCKRKFGLKITREQIRKIAGRLLNFYRYNRRVM
uniref:Flap endonuclease n=1 Tax=Dikerogammarus haemobaphes virus 1 TaxID=2704946 RepID=A0A6G9HDQ3_9VIRU|nr:flap endonuclease [Dikerogammarus haemobaphes virus 1]